MMTVVVRTGAGARYPGAMAQLTSTVTLVGLVTMSNTAERFWDWATRALMSSSVTHRRRFRSAP